MIHKFHRRRILMCFLVVVAGYAALVLRLYQIQVLQQKDWLDHIHASHMRTLPIRTSRGKIFSSTGTVLASSIPVDSLYADPSKVEAPRALAKQLAPLLGLDVGSIERKLSPRPDPQASPAPAPSPGGTGPGPSSTGSSPTATSSPGSTGFNRTSSPGAEFAGAAVATPATTGPMGLLSGLIPKVMNPPPRPEQPPRGKSRFVWVRRKLDEPTAKALHEFITTHKVKGLGFRKEFKRVYPSNQLAAQVIGFVGTDEEGLEGLENKYNGVLGGKPGDRTVVVAPNGMVITELARRKPEGFNNIHLTIDPVIQHYVERELDKAYAMYNPKNCFAAAMDPNTGEVLAMAGRPSFDPNAWREYDRELWKNRVVSDTFEPGSTFKLVTAAAALEDQRVEPIHTFVCPGKVVLWDIPIHCTGVHETITTEQMIERSCNVGAIKVGELLGPKNLYYYIRKFGFAERTGIDLPAEVEGIVRPPERWSGISIGAVSIGQEIGVSGIQMMQAVSAIANGGRLVRPHVIRKITEPETGAIVSESSLDVRHRVISQKTADALTRMMAMVVKSGSGTLAALDDYVCGGKTGTSEKLGRVAREDGAKYVASFIGFLPVKEPKVLIYVVLNEPKGERVRGGTTAAPVFREIARQVMLLRKVPPEVGAGTPTVPVTVAAPLRADEKEEPAAVDQGPAAAMDDEEVEGPDDADAEQPAQQPGDDREADEE